jgi:Tol biopolymer transport system component
MRLSKIFAAVGITVLGLFVTVRAAHATFPGENGKIVFTGNQSGTGQLYTMNADGSDMVQITHMPPTIIEGWLPNFSPDGKRILFYHDSAENPCTPNGSPFCLDLYVINADGSGLTRLTKDGLSWAGAWSPDGTRIVFNQFDTRTFVIRVVTMRADGRGARTTLTTAFWESGFAYFTPNGKSIVFYSQVGGLVSAAWVMNSGGANKVRLTPAALEGAPADISPDGQHVLLVSHVNTSLQNSIYTTGVSDKQLRRLTHPPGEANDIAGTYSPDGEKIVFVSSRFSSNQSLDIFTMNADGTDMRRIASGVTVGGCPDENCVSPSWGPKPR